MSNPNDPKKKSWIQIDPDSLFPIQNLPFGVFRMKNGKYSVYKQNLSEICNHISSTERKAVIAERNTVDRYMALIYSKKINQTFNGEVISVKNFGIFVKFDNNTSEGFIPKRLLPKDHYLFNEKREFLKGKSNFFKIGMSLLVSIKETDIFRGKILLGYCKHI